MITCPSCTKIVSEFEHEVVTRVTGAFLDIGQVEQLDELVKLEYGDHCQARNLCKQCLVDGMAECV